MIVCKFTCQEVANSIYGERVTLIPVSGKENEPWSSATPSGQFQIQITNPSARGKFTPGKSYMINISEAINVAEAAQ